ncbi:MAG: EF-hand domain-containing protein [Planctomycetia bacterium]|nr:EF-hand domain-containing protein [Planctomycetia bacterium]
MKHLVLGLMGMAIVLSMGCGLKKPNRVDAPTIDGSAAGAAAVKLYDKNGNGKIDGAELKDAPALNSVLKSLDTNGDGAIDAGEIATRIQGWADTKVGLTCPMISFTFKGKPMKAGSVTLKPVPFLAEYLKEAKGDIIDGSCNPTSEGNQENLPGMALGFYDIIIENAQPKLPADGKWGVEISDLNPMLQETGGSYQIELK